MGNQKCQVATSPQNRVPVGDKLYHAVQLPDGRLVSGGCEEFLYVTDPAVTGAPVAKHKSALNRDVCDITTIPFSNLIAHAGESMAEEGLVSNLIVENVDEEGINFHVRLEGYEVWSVLALDEDRIALGCGDGLIRIVSISRKKVVQSLKHDAPTKDRGKNIVHHLACDKDDVANSILATASQSGVVHVWSKKTLKFRFRLFSIPESVSAVSVSPKYVAASCYDSTVRVYSRASEGECAPVLEITHHKAPVLCVFVVADSDFVLSAGEDGLAFATNVVTGKKGWRANLRMHKNSEACGPTDIVVLRDGSIAVPVLEVLNGSATPPVESIELRIWKAPSCLPNRRTKLELGVKYESCSDGGAQSMEDPPLAHSSRLKRNADSDSHGIVAPLSGAKVSGGDSNSVVRDSSEGGQSKRHRSAANEPAVVANASTLLPPGVTGSSSMLHGNAANRMVQSVPPRRTMPPGVPLVRGQGRGLGGVADPGPAAAVGLDGDGDGAVLDVCKPKLNEATSRAAANDRNDVIGASNSPPENARAPRMSAPNTGGVPRSPPGSAGGARMAPSNNRVPTRSRVEAGPLAAERLLKKWNDSGLLQRDVLKMGQKELASALAGYILDFEFSRLEEFKVLERVFRGSFSCTSISNSSLRGKFGLGPESFAKLVKKGVESLVAEGAEDDRTAVWQETYDAAVANFLNEYFKS